jgi:hypothetical protein
MVDSLDSSSDLCRPDRPKPGLRHVQYHLVEHCNLDCKRCGHFSPLAAHHEADPEEFERDMRQLATRFANIEKIHLVGGEPTLHPKPEAFVDAAYTVFPKSDLRINTNGIRLKIMRDGFWDACRRANVTLEVSLYPVMEKAYPALEVLCERHRVKLALNHKQSFHAWINPRGDSDPARAMAYCRSMFYCPFLKNSRLYVCNLPATIDYYNDRFGRSIPGDAGIDIYDPALDGHQILEKLHTPVETCRFCSCAIKHHPWERAPQPRVEDYEAST